MTTIAASERHCENLNEARCVEHFALLSACLHRVLSKLAVTLSPAIPALDVRESHTGPLISLYAIGQLNSVSVSRDCRAVVNSTDPELRQTWSEPHAHHLSLTTPSGARSRVSQPPGQRRHWSPFTGWFEG